MKILLIVLLLVGCVSKKPTCPAYRSTGEYNTPTDIMNKHNKKHGK